MLRSVVVTIAGSIGILCVAWWVVSILAGLSLVVVTTGSMSPTIPTGAVVVSHRVPASDVRPGQVVTVPRPGADLPVTHRVVAVDPVAGDPAARQLTLRGDANRTDDRDPYVVRDAGRTVASAPGVGTGLQVVSQPLFRGTGVALVGLVIVWAFWPARRRPDAPTGDAPNTQTDDAQTDSARTADAPRHRAPSGAPQA
jgi:signal peptidase